MFIFRLSLFAILLATSAADSVDDESILDDLSQEYDDQQSPRSIALQWANELNSRGPEIDITQAPYQAGLIVDFVKILTTCGGSLISATRVVTAAHCNFHSSYISKSITVVLGTNYLFNGGVRFVTDDITIHPDFDSDILTNDVAVIKIPKVNFTAKIRPLHLPLGSYKYYDFTSQIAVASGYGLPSDSSKMSTKQCLNAVNLVVISNVECVETFGYPQVSSKTICTTGYGGVGTCDGDSGGPLVVYKHKRPILVGITSFGSEFCENGHPSAYTRVSEFISFITFV